MPISAVYDAKTRVVVDSRDERFLPKMTHPFVTIEHVGQIPRRPMTSLAFSGSPTFGQTMSSNGGASGPAASARRDGSKLQLENAHAVAQFGNATRIRMLDHLFCIAAPRLPEILDGRARKLVILEVGRLGVVPIH